MKEIEVQFGNPLRLINNITKETREIETEATGYWWAFLEHILSVLHIEKLENQEFFNIVTEVVHFINQANKMTFDGGYEFITQQIEEINARFV